MDAQSIRCWEAPRASRFLLETRRVARRRSSGATRSTAPTEGARGPSRSSSVTACRSVYSSSTSRRRVERRAAESSRPTKTAVIETSDSAQLPPSAFRTAVQQPTFMARSTAVRVKGHDPSSEVTPATQRSQSVISRIVLISGGQLTYPQHSAVTRLTDKNSHAIRSTRVALVVFPPQLGRPIDAAWRASS
jgi:hypothetical protein